MTTVQSKPQRPVGVTIIAIVAAAGGLLSLFGGASVLAGMASGPFALAIIVIIFGILGLTLGAGFFTGARWAWMAGIIRTIAGILIPVYLTRQKPKSFFGKGASSPGK